MKPLSSTALVIQATAVAVVLAVSVRADISGPYTADANTVHLFHLNEVSGSATANSGTAGNNAYTLDGNPLSSVVTTVLGAAAYTGFGNCANFGTATDLLIGYDANANLAFNPDLSGTSLSADAIALSTLGLNGTNPFTIEALVCPASAAGNREIICTDSSAALNANRGFQFRITTGGTTGQRLEFNLIGVAGTQKFGEIPASGTHAFATNTWFHAAFVYTGTVCRFYWTKLDPGVTTANLVGGDQALTITGGGTITGPLVLGNENRNIAGEGLTGKIDEVRISNVARAGSGFAFYNNDTDTDGLPDSWEMTYLGTLAYSGTDDPDGDGFDNNAERTAGSLPDNNISTPNDLDADSLPDAWEVTNFGSSGAQTGTGDADGDLATNLQEYLAGTNPDLPSSWPDTDADGMNDGWETVMFGDLSHNGAADTDGDAFTDLEEHNAHTNPAVAGESSAWAALLHRWTFNGTLVDSAGGSDATVVDVGANNVSWNDLVPANATGITLTGGDHASSDYIRLGGNLLPDSATPVTIEVWVKQNVVQNWSRIFDFQNGTGEYLMMAWTQGTNNATDRLEWKDNVMGATGNVATSLFLDNKNQPYGTTEEQHLVVVIEPLAGTAGKTKVTIYCAPAAASDLGAARGTGETTVNLVNFNDTLDALGYSAFTADNTGSATYDEVRIWRGALSAYAREKLHDQGPDNPVIEDTDNDRLPDAWELAFFPDLTTADTWGDNDSDTYANRDELVAGSRPDNSFSTPVDLDADGLTDTWEITYFGSVTAQTGTGDPDGDLVDNLGEMVAGTNPANPDDDADGLNDGWERVHFGNPVNYSGTDDPDLDGFTNEVEETAGSDPMVPASVPGDTDGDGLLDAWEIHYFTTLAAQSGGDDADSDGATNLEEYTAGSLPDLASSTPTDADGDSVPDATQVLQPYTADAHTLHLWHLDDHVAPAADAGTGPVSMASLANGAVLWLPAHAGFRTGLNTAAQANSRLGSLPEAADGTDNTISTYAGPDGAFTMEAIVQIGFDPAAPATPAVPMQIISADGDVAADRQFQFRILPTAGAPVLQFINLRGESGIQIVGVNIPTSGDHAIARNGWYHAAVSYNGTENTAGNIRMYWTKLDPSFTEAHEITSGAENLAADMIVPAAGSDLVIGNEGRSTGGTTDRFFGMIDEVRVSSVARASTEFLFHASGPPDTDSDTLPDPWETTYFGDLAQGAAGDYDHDGTSNRAEYLLGLVPNDGASRFAAAVSDAQVSWPSATGLSFTVLRSTDLASWTSVGTVTATGASATWTDPSPPAGRAFYKVELTTP